MPEGKTSYRCNIGECDFERKTKDFTTSKWADHVVLDCRYSTAEIKNKVANAHQTKRVIQDFKLKKQASHPAASSTNSISTKRSFPSSEFMNNGNSTKQRRLGDYVDHCNSARASIIVKHITEFMVGCALPFTIVSSVFFINMVKSLNSAF